MKENRDEIISKLQAPITTDAQALAFLRKLGELYPQDDRVALLFYFYTQKSIKIFETLLEIEIGKDTDAVLRELIYKFHDYLFKDPSLSPHMQDVYYWEDKQLTCDKDVQDLLSALINAYPKEEALVPLYSLFIEKRRRLLTFLKEVRDHTKKDTILSKLLTKFHRYILDKAGKYTR